MKVIIALAVLATSAVSFAADSREIQDIMYLPNAGKSYGFSTGEYLSSKLKVKDGNDTTIKGTQLTQTLGHSFTDRLAVQAAMNYTELTTNPDGSPKTHTTGFSDPTISARFRTVDEAFRWDVIGGATVTTGNRVIRSNDSQNNLQGGSSLFVGTQFGGKSESFQWAVLGQLTHNMQATNKVSGAGKVKDDANNALLLRADILSRLGDRTFLRSNVAGNFAQDFKNDQTPKRTTPAITTYSIGTELQHKLSEDLMLRAGVDYAIFNVRTGQIDSFNAWKYLVGANYQF